jgi:hypothetical protein
MIITGRKKWRKSFFCLFDSSFATVVHSIHRQRRKEKRKRSGGGHLELIIARPVREDEEQPKLEDININDKNQEFSFEIFYNNIFST